MVPVQNKNKKFLRKKIIEHFYGSWNLKSGRVQGREILAMKIISLESLHSVLWKNVSNRSKRILS